MQATTRYNTKDLLLNTLINLSLNDCSLDLSAEEFWLSFVSVSSAEISLTFVCDVLLSLMLLVVSSCFGFVFVFLLKTADTQQFNAMPDTMRRASLQLKASISSSRITGTSKEPIPGPNERRPRAIIFWLSLKYDGTVE